MELQLFIWICKCVHGIASLKMELQVFIWNSKCLNGIASANRELQPTELCNYKCKCVSMNRHVIISANMFLWIDM